MKRFMLFFTIVCLIAATHGQEYLNKYEFDFNLTEGIYLTFKEFKYNSPTIKKDKIIRVVPIRNDNNYINRTIRKIYFEDIDGSEQFLKINEIWGICSNKSIFIRLGSKLHKVEQVGALSFFYQNKKDATSHEFMSLDGFVGPIEKANPYSIPHPTDLPDSPDQNSGEYLKYNLPCILDFENGEVLYFTRKNFLLKLKNDPELYDEYTSITDHKRQYYLMMQYLTRFNERNSITFPSNKGTFGGNVLIK